jgi:hypothetical protein
MVALVSYVVSFSYMVALFSYIVQLQGYIVQKCFTSDIFLRIAGLWWQQKAYCI